MLELKIVAWILAVAYCYGDFMRLNAGRGERATVSASAFSVLCMIYITWGAVTVALRMLLATAGIQEL